jgi:hypothetical protein
MTVAAKAKDPASTLGETKLEPVLAFSFSFCVGCAARADVASIMSYWTEQMNYPLLTVANSGIDRCRVAWSLRFTFVRLLLATAQPTTRSQSRRSASWSSQCLVWRGMLLSVSLRGLTSSVACCCILHSDMEAYTWDIRVSARAGDTVLAEQWLTRTAGAAGVSFDYTPSAGSFLKVS